MHTFFSEKKKDKYLVIEGREFKHFKVRRISGEETFRVIYQSELYLCKAYKVEKEIVLCNILEKLPVEEVSTSITLYQCITTDIKTFEEIIRFSTELGVKELVPTFSARSFRNKKAVYKKMERWEKIVRESMKLSGRTSPLSIAEPIDIQRIETNHDVNLILDNFHEGKSMNEIDINSKDYGIVVGPEGGFTEKESKTLRDKGFESVRLKPYVMRAETASLLVCGAIINLCNP